MFCSAGYGLAIVPKDFASYLLGIVLINLNMYFFFYIIMKVQCIMSFYFLYLLIHNIWLAVWLSGNALADQRSCATSDPVSTGWVTVCGWVNHLGM